MKKNFLILVFSIIILSIIFFVFEKFTYTNNEVKAKVIYVNNEDVIQAGLNKIGSQSLRVELLSGENKNKKIKAINHLYGKLEFDNYYKINDIIIVGLNFKDSDFKDSIAIDLYRQKQEFILFSLFIVILLLYAKIIGLKAIFSFAMSLLVIWKILIPGLLNNMNPLILTSFVIIFLTGIIVFCVAGFSKKGFSAFLGTIFGLFTSIFVTLYFGEKMRLFGMTAPFAQALLHNGYLHLNMKYIFYSAVILGASGAAMDIAMDVSASMEEIKLKKPSITTSELIESGFNIGKSVIGTMTTTLLLAYSGGYLTLIMLFMSKESSLARILNMKIVCAEIVRIVVGSIGLVLVAPFSAFFAGFILCNEFKIQKYFNKLNFLNVFNFRTKN